MEELSEDGMRPTVPPHHGQAVASMVLGIFSIILGIFVVFNVVLVPLAVVLGYRGRMYRSGKAGLILGALGLFYSAMCLIFFGSGVRK